MFGRLSATAPQYGRGRGEFIVTMIAIFSEALRVLRPGAHALVWAIPRTSHWTATALEDAGFEIRDVIHHLFGTGYPKSRNVDGRGTTLKPAAEHWILARKPLAGTVTANVQAHATGTLNIDECRIGGVGGRWPANVVLSHSEGCGPDVPVSAETISTARWVCAPGCAVAELDTQSGTLKSGSMAAGVYAGRKGTVYSRDAGRPLAADIIGSTGGASRFFYCAKPSPAEREAGCEDLPVQPDGEAGAGRRNHHPTVKSVGDDDKPGLMRWLVRLVTPTGGVVLDPFMGSGSTGMAAVLEGFKFVGIERDPAYKQIADARICYALEKRL